MRPPPKKKLFQTKMMYQHPFLTCFFGDGSNHGLFTRVARVRRGGGGCNNLNDFFHPTKVDSIMPEMVLSVDQWLLHHLYTTYILPSGGLYATYHLLREPDTTIDQWMRLLQCTAMTSGNLRGLHLSID